MKAVIVSLLILTTSFAYCQKLSFQEFISIDDFNLTEVEEYFSTRNWELTSIEKDAIEFFKEDGNDITLVNIVFRVGNEKVLLTSIIFYNQTVYLNYLEGIKKLGCKVTKSEISENNLEKDYSNGIDSFKVELLSQADGATAYRISRVKRR